MIKEQKECMVCNKMADFKKEDKLKRYYACSHCKTIWSEEKGRLITDVETI